MSAELELSGRPLPGPAAMEGGPDATWRPRHTSSSSDISSEGKLVSSKGHTSNAHNSTLFFWEKSVFLLNKFWQFN
jgi:hypothetical protein